MSKIFWKNTLGLQVLTPSGFQDFAGIADMGVQPVRRIDLDSGSSIRCTSTHRFQVSGKLKEAGDLFSGDVIDGSNGRGKAFVAAEDTAEDRVFDLVEVAGGNLYLTNDLVSHNCDFVSDDETLISALKLVRMTGSAPIQYTGTVRWFQEVVPNKTYLVALDPSLGTGGDNAAMQVFQLPEMVQVAEWQHNETAPRGQVRTLLQTLLYIDDVLREHPEQRGDPDIYWTVENNSLGEAVLLIIEDSGEERFPGIMVSERRRAGGGRSRKGLNTTNRNKLAACSRMKSLVESDRMTIRSSQLIKELKNFVATESSFRGKLGSTDDLVMATILIVRMLDTALAWGAGNGDLREHIDDDELGDIEAMPVSF